MEKSKSKKTEEIKQSIKQKAKALNGRKTVRK